MQYVNLLCTHVETSTLREFAELFFKAVGVADSQERESSNHVDGRYFKGSSKGAQFTVSLSDEEGHDDLPYWVQVAADLSVDGALDEAVDRIARERLSAPGFKVARIVNFGKRGAQRIDCLRDPSP